MGVMNIRRCGTCSFAKILGQDLSKRICFGAPPSVTSVQMPNGKIAVSTARPAVNVTDDACALYRDKDMFDRMRDAQQPELFETKQ